MNSVMLTFPTKRASMMRMTSAAGESAPASQARTEETMQKASARVLQ